MVKQSLEQTDALLADAEALVRRCLAGQQLDDATVRSAAAKIVRALPRSVRIAPHHRRRT